MNKKEKFSFLKGKGASVGIVLCFVAVIAMVGTVTFRNYKKNMNEQIAKVQQETEKLTKENDAAELVIVTEAVKEKHLEDALAHLVDMDTTREIGTVIREY